MEADGVDIRPLTTIKKFEKVDNKIVKVYFKRQGEEGTKVEEFDTILFATGR